MIKFIIAYIALLCILVIFAITLLAIFGYIEYSHGSGIILIYLIFLPLSIIYDKLKPMSLKEVFKKYLGIKILTWETISYKMKVFIGIDPDYLDKDKK